MGFSATHLLLLLVVVVLLFGRNKISDLMGDVARGIKSFKKGMADDEPETPKTIDQNGVTAEQAAQDKNKAG
jgi:sec-independent protein translocase protein TatA